MNNNNYGYYNNLGNKVVLNNYKPIENTIRRNDSKFSSYPTTCTQTNQSSIQNSSLRMNKIGTTLY